MQDIMQLVDSSPFIERLGLVLLLGVLANVFADLVLRLRYTSSFRLDTQRKRMLRLGRWIVCLVGLIAVALFSPSSSHLILLALLSVSAATDFEHRRLPWDWFLYGSVLVGIGLAWLDHGWDGFSHALIAQAVLYGFVTMTVVVFGATAGGDIKVAMQYGSACGHLGRALNGMLMASVLMIPLSLISLMLYRRLPRYAPLASYVWVAALLTYILEGRLASFI